MCNVPGVDNNNLLLCCMCFHDSVVAVFYANCLGVKWIWKWWYHLPCLGAESFANICQFTATNFKEKCILYPEGESQWYIWCELNMETLLLQEPISSNTYVSLLFHVALIGLIVTGRLFCTRSSQVMYLWSQDMTSCRGLCSRVIVNLNWPLGAKWEP